MRNKFCIVTIVLGILLFNSAIASSEIAEESARIEEFFSIDINNCSQQVLIQSDNIVTNPILLYLHGGPGSSAMMYSHLYSGRLRKHVIFVNWDMRGAGLSYHDGINPESVSEEQIAKDAVVLIRYLRDRFKKEKIFLLGHSFGSVLGMYLVNNYPDLFYAYIGVGQVIDYKKSVPITYAWLHEVLKKNDDAVGLERIERDSFPYIDLVVKYGGHHDLSIDLHSIIRNSPYYAEGYLDVLAKGKQFSAENVAKNPKHYKYPSEIKETEVPLYFFEGRNDHVIACAPELVVEYCNSVKAPKKEIIWFEHSAHYVTVEEPDKFQTEIIKIVEDNMR